MIFGLTRRAAKVEEPHTQGNSKLKTQESKCPHPAWLNANLPGRKFKICDVVSDVAFAVNEFMALPSAGKQEDVLWA